MPFIHIKSLPFKPPLPMNGVVEGITRDFSTRTGIDIEHITATWDFMEPGHYAVAGQAASSQQTWSHPVLVDLLVPDFNTAEAIEEMLLAIASSISERTGVPAGNVFINCRKAVSGQVFDGGKIVRW